MGAVGRLSGDRRGRCARVLAEAAAAPTWSSRPAASACSTTSCSPASSSMPRPGALRIFWDVDAPATLDEMRARRRTIRSARALPALDLVLTYGGGDAGRRRLRGLRRAPLRADLQRARSRRRTIRCRRTRASPATSSFLGNRLPDREARVEEFFLEPRSGAARAAASCSAAPAGTTRPMPPNVRAPRPRLHARPQRLQLHAAGGAQRRARQHGAISASRRRRACSKRPAPAPA